jgi:hypothetical protein
LKQLFGPALSPLSFIRSVNKHKYDLSIWDRTSGLCFARISETGVGIVLREPELKINKQNNNKINHLLCFQFFFEFYLLLLLLAIPQAINNVSKYHQQKLYKLNKIYT